MIIRIGFVILFIINVMGLALIPKGKQEESGIHAIMMGNLMLISMTSLVATAISLLGIAVDLRSIGVFYLLLAIGLVMYLILKRQVQKLTVDRWEILTVFGLSIVFLLVEWKTFSYELRASFVDQHDYANHLYEALQVARTGRVKGMSFAAVFNGLIIDIVKPLLSEVKWYKGFILADCIHYLMHMLFFYGLLLEMFATKRSKKWLPLIVVLYWCGYPMMQMIAENSPYWDWAVMLILAMIYWCHEWETHRSKKGICYLGIILAGLCLAQCYTLFVPMIYGLLCLWVILQWNKSGKRISGKTLVIVGICLLVVCLVMIVFFQQQFSSFAKIKKYLTLNAITYFNLFGNFILFLPVLYVYCRHYRRKNCLTFLLKGTILGMCGFFCLVLAGWMSTYYYSKFYAILWGIVWLLMADVINVFEWNEHTRRPYKAYLVMMVLLYLLAFVDAQSIIQNRLYVLDYQNMRDNWQDIGTDIYATNMHSLKQDYDAMKYTNENLEIDAYVIEALQGKTVGFAGEWETIADAKMHHAISGQICLQARIAGGMDWQQAATEEKCEYVMLLKTSNLYQENEQEVRSHEVIYENEQGLIISW